MRLGLAFVALSLAAPAAAVPTQLTHQGALRDALGAPLEGEHAMGFALYDAASGGTPLWSEDLNVSFEGGVFTATLGLGGTPLDSDLFDGGVKHLAIRVDGGPEMPTRVPVRSVPYALRAAVAGAVEGGVVDASELRINGTTVIGADGTISGSLAWSDLGDVPSGLDDGDDDTLADLACDTGEVAVWSGSAWGCDRAMPATVDVGLLNGTISVDNLPIGTGSGQVAAGDHVHGFGEITGVAAIGQLPTGTTGSSVALGNHSHALTGLSGDLPFARVSGDLDVARLSGVLSVTQIPTGTTSGTVALGNHNHALNSLTGDLPLSRTTGSLEVARVSGSLPLSQTSGTLDVSRVSGNLPLGQTSGTLDVARVTGTVPVGQLPTGTTGSTVALGNHTHAPITNWNVCATDSDNGSDVGTVIMSCPITKQYSTSALKLTYSDNMRVYGHGGWCQWEIEVDNQRCAGPTPAIRAAVYSSNDDGQRNNNHEARTVVGVCDRVGSGVLGAGPHTVRVRISDGNSDCYTGWNQTSILMIEEILR